MFGQEYFFPSFVNSNKSRHKEAQANYGGAANKTPMADLYVLCNAE